MNEKLSERLIERAEFEDERVLKEAKAMGFVPEVYSGSQTGALLREAAAVLRAVEGDAVDAERYRFLRDGPDHPCKHPCVYAFLPGDKEYPKPLGGERLDAAIDQARSVPLDAAGSAEGVG